MRKTLVLLLISVLSACVQKEPSAPQEKTPVEKEPEKEPFQSICEFDMGVAEEEFSLAGEWEFVGFEDLETGALGEKDQTTCLARWAYHAQHENEEKNTFQILLTFGNQSYGGKVTGCGNKYQMDALGFDAHLRSCYVADEQGFLDIKADQAFFLYDYATIFPYLGFNEKYFKALERITYYEIDNNRLYLYFGNDRYRLTYLSLASRLP